jgi:hypothetical protein
MLWHEVNVGPDRRGVAEDFTDGRQVSAVHHKP